MPVPESRTGIADRDQNDIITFFLVSGAGASRPLSRPCARLGSPPSPETKENVMAYRDDWKTAFMASELPPNTRLLLHTLSTRMSREGRDARVSITEITRLSGLSRPTIIRHIRIAYAAGWVHIDLDTLRAGQGLAHKYDATRPPE